MKNQVEIDPEIQNKCFLFQNIMNKNWNAIVFANPAGIIEYVNPRASELYGYDEGELIGQNVDIFNSHLTYNTEEIIQSIMAKGAWRGELIQRKKDNTTFDAYLDVQLIIGENGTPLGYSSNSKDITEEKETALKLKKTITEKETLLKELQHRVKNNLAIILSMIRLQKDKFKDEYHTSLINDYEARVEAVASLHHTLYLSEKVDEVNLKDYLHRLCNNLNEGLFNTKKEIDLILSVEAIDVPITEAVSCGLIVNEMLTNAFKHAFPSSKKGKIKVCFKKEEENKFCLTISDNGTGFAYHQKKESDASLGLSLIEGLVEQLDGEIIYNNKNGSNYTIKFALEE